MCESEASKQKNCSKNLIPVRDKGGVEAVEVPTRSLGPIRLWDNMQRTGPGYNASFLHLEELSLGGSKIVWIHVVGLGADWRTKDLREVVENTMIWRGG